MPNAVILAVQSVALHSLGSPSAQWQDPDFNRDFARDGRIFIKIFLLLLSWALGKKKKKADVDEPLALFLIKKIIAIGDTHLLLITK